MGEGTRATQDSKKRQSGLSLTALRVFVAVVDAGSFSRAAEALGMSQPNVSLQVVNLEQTCGVRLLQRRQPVALTDAGRDLFVRARLILSRVEEFESSVRDLRDLQRGRLTVGFSSPAAALQLIAAFLRAHPGIEIATGLGNTESLLADIQNCRIDIGIMTLTEPRPSLSNTLIAKQHLVACLPRRHRLARADAISLAELAGEPLVVREAGSMTQQLFDRACAQRGLSPQARLRVASREALKEAVAQGIGLGVVLHDEAGSDARLRHVPITGIAVAAGIYAVCLNESMDLPAVAAFASLAAEAGATT